MIIILDKIDLPKEALDKFEALEDKNALLSKLLQAYYEFEKKQDEKEIELFNKELEHAEKTGEWYTDEEVFNRIGTRENSYKALENIFKY